MPLYTEIERSWIRASGYPEEELARILAECDAADERWDKFERMAKSMKESTSVVVADHGVPGPISTDDSARDVDISTDGEREVNLVVAASSASPTAPPTFSPPADAAAVVPAASTATVALTPTRCSTPAPHQAARVPEPAVVSPATPKSSSTSSPSQEVISADPVATTKHPVVTMARRSTPVRRRDARVPASGGLPRRPLRPRRIRRARGGRLATARPRSRRRLHLHRLRRLLLPRRRDVPGRGRLRHRPAHRRLPPHARPPQHRPGIHRLLLLHRRLQHRPGIDVLRRKLSTVRAHHTSHRMSAAAVFDPGVSHCLGNLEAASWAEEDDEKLVASLTQLYLKSSGIGEVLKRVSLSLVSLTMAEDCSIVAVLGCDIVGLAVAEVVLGLLEKLGVETECIGVYKDKLLGDDFVVSWLPNISTYFLDVRHFIWDPGDMEAKKHFYRLMDVVNSMSRSISLLQFIPPRWPTSIQRKLIPRILDPFPIRAAKISDIVGPGKLMAQMLAGNCIFHHA